MPFAPMDPATRKPEEPDISLSDLGVESVYAYANNSPQHKTDSDGLSAALVHPFPVPLRLPVPSLDVPPVPAPVQGLIAGFVIGSALNCYLQPFIQM